MEVYQNEDTCMQGVTLACLQVGKLKERLFTNFKLWFIFLFSIY